MELDYRTICNNILRGLHSRSKDVLERRFGLGSDQEKWTLELIGRDFGICRERVRQIEEDAVKQVKESSKIYYQKPLQYIENYIRQRGGLKKEESLISELVFREEKGDKNRILFLLNLGDQFKKFRENREFYSFWAVDLLPTKNLARGENSIETAKRIIADFIKFLNLKQKPLALDQYIREKSPTQNFGVGGRVPARTLFSYLEISKSILRTPEGWYGLPDWPEINPRGVKDRAYIALKQVNKPLHFVEVARSLQKPTVHTQPLHIGTIHNELIKDSRFVLVGRGIYALREWGYQPGVVREVIADIFKKSRKPLSKSEILKEVQKQRLVKENTILLNLNNKEYFLRDSRGKYYIREA